MLRDAALFLPLCAVVAVVYQTTRNDDLTGLARRAARSFLVWTAGMAALSGVVVLVSMLV